MSAVSRTYTFVDGTDAYGSQIELELNTIYNAWNNHDAGTSTWTVVKTTTLTSLGVTTLKGSATNDSAATGNMGEYISSAATANSNAAANGVFDDVTSISLTAGDWDISGGVDWDVNGATVTQFRSGISITSGNSETGMDEGNQQASFVQTAISGRLTLFVPTVRISLASTTTVYLKRMAAFSAGTPRSIAYRISARRVR